MGFGSIVGSDYLVLWSARDTDETLRRMPRRVSGWRLTTIDGPNTCGSTKQPALRNAAISLEAHPKQPVFEKCCCPQQL